MCAGTWNIPRNRGAAANRYQDVLGCDLLYGPYRKRQGSITPHVMCIILMCIAPFNAVIKAKSDNQSNVSGVQSWGRGMHPKWCRQCTCRPRPPIRSCMDAESIGAGVPPKKEERDAIAVKPNHWRNQQPLPQKTCGFMYSAWDRQVAWVGTISVCPAPLRSWNAQVPPQQCIVHRSLLKVSWSTLRLAHTKRGTSGLSKSVLSSH